MEQDKKPDVVDLRITVERSRGSREYVCCLEALSSAEALAGICAMVGEFAKRTGMPVGGVIARMAAVMLSPKGRDLRS